MHWKTVRANVSNSTSSGLETSPRSEDSMSAWLVGVYVPSNGPSGGHLLIDPRFLVAASGAHMTCLSGQAPNPHARDGSALLSIN